MGRKTVLVDDLDGTDLPDDAQPIRLSLGRTTYSLYLSEDNHGKLLEALNPFIENAETLSASAARRTPSTASRTNNTVDTYGYPIADVRAWAQKTKYTQENGKTIGDKGRIPQAVYDAYKAAQA